MKLLLKELLSKTFDNLNYFCRQGSFALHIGTKRNSISVKFTLYMKSVKIKAKSIIFSSL